MILVRCHLSVVGYRGAGAMTPKFMERPTVTIPRVYSRVLASFYDNYQPRAVTVHVLCTSAITRERSSRGSVIY